MSTTEIVPTDDGGELICIDGACYRTDIVQKSLRAVHRDGTLPNEFVDITWQHGPIEEAGVNGAGVEDLIDIAIERLRELNEGAMRCRENSLAITALEEARNWLTLRTMSRIRQFVEGRMLPHESE